MASDTPLRHADRVLIGVCAQLVCGHTHAAEDMALFRATLQDVLPRVSQGHAYVGPIFHACTSYLSAPDRTSRDAALSRVRMGLFWFFRWSTGGAYQQYKNEAGGKR